MTMTTETQAKPDYLSLLNAISLAESRAGVYLKAWADVTPDPELKQALVFVAGRETSHGEVFRQRIERLGFTLREREDPDFEGRLRLYSDPDISDLDKLRHPRYGRRSENEGGTRWRASTRASTTRRSTRSRAIRCAGSWPRSATRASCCARRTPAWMPRPASGTDAATARRRR